MAENGLCVIVLSGFVAVVEIEIATTIFGKTMCATVTMIIGTLVNGFEMQQSQFIVRFIVRLLVRRG